MESFLTALEEVYAFDPVDKFAEPREIWRELAYELSLKLKVDYADMGRSREFTTVLVKKITKHPILKEVEYTVLKYLRHVFAATSNVFKREATNIKFEAELAEVLYTDEQYQNKNTMERFLFLCEGLIIRWKRLGI